MARSGTIDDIAAAMVEKVNAPFQHHPHRIHGSFESYSNEATATAAPTGSTFTEL